RHEAVDDAVEYHAVIVALPGQLLDALDVIGREVRPEFDGDRSARCLDDQGILRASRHVATSYCWALSAAAAAFFDASSASAATCILMILSGLEGGSPGLILSTASMPSITWPQIVYLPSRNGAGAKSMKNWLLALSGSLDRAAPTVPRPKLAWLVNSA